MNLVGYTATALSRNDIIDTPTNKNVVDFAIVELKDLQGNLVVMYDDAEGANPETQKTCDTNGQVTFFAEAGDYDLEINGKAQRINLAANIADYIKLGTGESVQDFVDSFALKIFQSPTDGGLTEIQTRTVDAGEVYEVRKTSDNSLATIYSDAAGTAEIVQNGTDNKSGSDGVIEFYIADGDYYIEVGGIESKFDILSFNFDTVPSMISYDGHRVGNIYTVSDSGSLYEVVTSQTANGRTIHDLGSGLYAYFKHDGKASVRQAGVEYSETQTSLGLAIQSLLAVGVKNIIIENPDVTFNGTIDLQGANVFGKGTVYSTGNFFNGQLHGIKRAAQDSQFVNKTSDFPMQVSKDRVKAVVKVSGTPNGVSSPNGEDYCILSPSSFGGVAMFFLHNGTGTTASGNLGAPFDRLRPVNTYIANGGVTLQDTPDSTTGTQTVTAFDLLRKYYNASLSTRWASIGSTDIFATQMAGGATSTFTIAGNKRKSNVVFYTSSGSSNDCTITVNGQLVKTFSAQTSSGNQVGIVEFELPRNGSSENTVVVNAGTVQLYLWGIDFYEVNDLPNTDDNAGSFYKIKNRYIMHSYSEITYSGTGASLDTVIVDQDLNFGGSYHGGDLAYNAQVDIRIDGVKQIRCNTSAYTETNTALTLNVGESYMGRSIRVRYSGVIQANPVMPIRMTWDFGIDGGCNVTGWYSASSDTPFITIYTGMHSTSRQILNTPWKAYSSTASESTDEIKDDLNLVQYGIVNNHIAIYPQKSNADASTILARLWDNANYLKYYYTPVALPSSTGGLVLKNGETFEFGCLYQYGRSII